MFGITGPVLYVIIFFGKLVEVSLMTLRIMFASKGQKLFSAVCGLFEIVIWIFIAGTVLTQLDEDPLKAVIYCVAFTIGITMGVVIENKMAVGLTSVQIVALAEIGEKIGAALREQGFGVTILDGHSVNGTRREMVFVQLKRKRIRECEKIVRSVCPDAMMSVSDVKLVVGGFMK